MLDFSHIPQNLRSNFSMFYNTGQSSTGIAWQVWNKPRGITSVYILCIGGGGRGATGATTAAGTVAGGGGGGGAGGITTLLIHANLIPDILYVFPGQVGAAGANQINSYVSVQPSTAAAYVLCYANYGTNASGGSGGSGGGAATTTNMILGSYGKYNIYAGPNGSTGVAGGVGGVNNWGTSGVFICGGAAGGGKTTGSVGQAGGDIVGNGLMPSVLGGAALTNGRTGFDFVQPLMSCGGSGGGGAAAAVAGNGGNGGFGSGGGGGGAATTTTGTPGSGGLGGSGLVMIWGF